jgi:hypothetical protein
MKHTIALITALLLTSLAALHAADPQPLKQYRRVVIADDALPVQRAAAEELATYAGRVAQQKIEIVTLGKLAPEAPGLSFFVGDGAAERALGKSPKPWKSEEWMLRTVPTGLVLAGEDGPGIAWTNSTRAGSMHAVYTFLEEHLGVRWFWPGEFGEHVPVKPDANVPPLDLRRTPAFEIRFIQLGYLGGYQTKSFSDESRKWARRNHLAWVRSAVFGHSWGTAFETAKGETFKQHPEWFALVNGKRQPSQMCSTNPEVIDYMVDYVLKGKQDIVNISPNDGGGFCQCERCRALDVPGILAYDKKTPQLSDRVITYANEVARRVREKNPAKGCGMFAYTFYHQPPVKIAKLEPNLYISFAYQCAAQRDPQNLREWRECVTGWQKLDAKLVVREGWGSHYQHDLPLLHPQQIIANLAEASRLGFIAAYGEGSKSFVTQAPNFWALTHMMWDPQRDSTHLMREFYESAYGPVAKEMQAFFEAYEHALDANWSKRDRVVDSTEIAYANIMCAWGKLIPQEAIEQAERHLKDAEAKVPAGEYADRVKFHRFGQDYTRTMLGLLNTYRRLAVLGVKMGEFSNVVRLLKEPLVDSPDERDALLREAYELGERREAMLLAHREWAGPDEGLYAFTNEIKTRQWHTAVKRELKIDKPTALTKETLAEKVTKAIQ